MRTIEVGQIWRYQGSTLKIIEKVDDDDDEIFRYEWVSFRYKPRQGGGILVGIDEHWQLYDPYPDLYVRMVELIHERV